MRVAATSVWRTPTDWAPSTSRKMSHSRHAVPRLSMSVDGGLYGERQRAALRDVHIDAASRDWKVIPFPGDDLLRKHVSSQTHGQVRRPNNYRAAGAQIRAPAPDNDGSLGA